MSNDYLAEIAAKLTWNGAYNLLTTVTNPCPLNPDALHGRGRMHLGLGKWTTLGVIGVENHLKKHGLAEDVTMESGYERCLITPLGREMATYLHQNWDELRHTFRDGRRK